MTAETTTRVSRDDLQEAVERVLAVCSKHRDDGEQQRRLPDAVFQAMREQELFNIWVPKEYGGREVSLPAFMRATERIAAADAAAGWTFCILAAGPILAAALPPGGAAGIFAAGPNAPVPGSVIPNGRAVPVEGGYRLSGRWPLVSGFHFGDWVATTALVFDGDAPRMLGAMPDLHTMFVRREDCKGIDTWHSLGMRGTGSIDIVVEDAFVPEEHASSLFGTPSQVSGALYKAGPLVLFSMAVASVLPGIARSAIDAFVELAREKTPTLSQTGLASRPTIHAEVARAEARLQAARAFFYEVAAEIMTAVETGGSLPDDLEARRRLACIHLAESCRGVVDGVFTLAGSTPIYSGHRLERCLRDIHTAGQHLVVSPVWWEKTGQYYFGLGLGMP